jgi:cyclopropane fatty-acyl-phospholipid synthase-like methyltransferase
MEQKDDNTWYSTWFDSPYYHILYQHRNHAEAEKAVCTLLAFANVEKGSEVMDLCCGKGRHATLLEKAGNIVTGLDLSPANINYCRTFENENLHFNVHDMREVYKADKFDYVFNLFTSFGYFDHEGNEQTLIAIKEGLKAGGKVIIDFLNVTPVITALPAQEIISLDGIDFYIHKYLENNRIYKQIKFTDKGCKYSFCEEVNALQLSDFERYFEHTGFKLISVSGDYDGSSFNKHQSKRLILLAERK